MNKRLLNRMIALAAEKHANQYDKQGEPYFLHLMQVMRNTESNDEIVQCVAVGHDLIEDTDVTYEQVLEEFGAEIADGIEAMSKRKGEAYEDYLERVLANPLASRVKMADLQHNTLITRMRGTSPKDLERVAKYWRAYALLKERVENG